MTNWSRGGSPTVLSQASPLIQKPKLLSSGDREPSPYLKWKGTVPQYQVHQDDLKAPHGVPHIKIAVIQSCWHLLLLLNQMSSLIPMPTHARRLLFGHRLCPEPLDLCCLAPCLHLSVHVHSAGAAPDQTHFALRLFFRLCVSRTCKLANSTAGWMKVFCKSEPVSLNIHPIRGPITLYWQ